MLLNNDLLSPVIEEAADPSVFLTLDAVMVKRTWYLVESFGKISKLVYPTASWLEPCWPRFYPVKRPLQ